MCGFIGVFPKQLHEDVASCLASIAHRGPDDYGLLLNQQVQLGHRRLAIQDLSANGHQPMQVADGKVWIAFNGEIYNHLDIRRQLPKGIDYRSSSDTETLLYAYLEYGVDLLDKLNGIFAFAIYDLRQQQLFIARDQLGVKPLYYYHRRGQLLFGSELKALCTLPGVEQALNPTALVNYVNFLWSPGQATPFAHFKKLEPGHYFTFDLQRPETEIVPIKYYELPFDGHYATDPEQELTDHLDALLCQAVERQLLSDVPVGFFLSGGLDSSLIAAIARKKIGAPFRCYTIRANTDAASDGFANDLAYAQQVALHLDVDLNIVEGDADIVRDFDSMIWHLDEPQADPAPLHVRNICRIARQCGDVVLLGGTAGDDLFSGYRRHQALQLESWFGMLPPSMGSAFSAAGRLLPTRSPHARRLRKISQQLGKTRLQRMAGYYAWIDLPANKALFADRFEDELRSYDPADQLLDALHAIPQEHNPLNQMLFWDTKYFLTDHNLNYTDKMSMAEGVEVRVPFLDLDLVQFACQLPPALKMRGNTTKYLLKKVAERYLPHDVIYRPKTGFGAPVRQWVVDGRFDQRMKGLLQRAAAPTSVFSKTGVERLWTATKSGRMDGAYSVWSVMAIDSWMKQFAEASSPAPGLTASLESAKCRLGIDDQNR